MSTNRAADPISDLTHTFDDVVASIQDVGNDDEHDPDGSTIAFERAQVAALLDAAYQRLTALDAAIERIAAGTYGMCEGCGCVMSAERLEALPANRWCVTCAS